MTKNPLSFFRQNDKKLPETLYDSALALFLHFRYTVNQQRKLRKKQYINFGGKQQWQVYHYLTLIKLIRTASRMLPTHTDAEGSYYRENFSFPYQVSIPQLWLAVNNSFGFFFRY